MSQQLHAVTGAGGFIGAHLVTHLKAKGHKVIAIDIKAPQFSTIDADLYKVMDLRTNVAALAKLIEGVDRVWHLAANMGGMGVIGNPDYDLDVMQDNLRIDMNVLEASMMGKVGRLLFSSSACVYPESRQLMDRSEALHEVEAYPAEPDTEYGWAKLTTERLCALYSTRGKLETRVARFHNIYGPLGTWQGGREKAPAAICRKMAEARRDGEDVIDVWGDGEQRRSFCYIDDCLSGLEALMESSYALPLNIGSDRSVSINELVRLVAAVAGVEVRLNHVVGPVGVRGRNSDNRKCLEVLEWSPQVTLEEGIAVTYDWIEGQVCASGS
jgi:nucleoside-diphosphate-sugar epimerase